MRFDAPDLAHAWLAVATAAGSEKDLPVLYRTVVIEEYPSSVRLYSTDRFMLLTAWVADIDQDYGAQPAFDESPDRVVIAADPDGLGRKLLGHAVSLVNRIPPEDYVTGMVEVRLDFDVRVPAGQDVDEAFEGLEPTYVQLTVPDVEKVYLPVVVATPPDWRPIFDSFTPEETKQVALNPEFLERLGKVRKHAAGPLVWKFGGSDRLAMVDWPESDPRVHGAVMPRRRDEDDDQASPAGTAACPDCAAGRTCLRHATGVIVIGRTEDETVQLRRRAAELVISTQFGSQAMLKRKLSLTAERARLLMADLEEAGIVGPQEGTRAREVLHKPDQAAAVIDAAFPIGGDS